MGKIKEVDTKFKELKRSISMKKPFDVFFSKSELTLLVLRYRYRS